jgi:predicted nucleic acid-binding protein
VCFNHHPLGEPFVADLLIDAGVLVAHFDKEDVWHDAVEDFFDTYVYNSTHAPTFYVTPDIINEYLHRSIENYKDRTGRVAPASVRREYADAIADLLASGAVEHVDLTQQDTLSAIQRWARSSYGAKDAFHISVQLDWGLDLITVDHNLMEELENDPDFAGRKVYYPDLSMRKQLPRQQRKAR